MSSSQAASSVRVPTRGRLYTPILEVVPPVATAPRPILVAGLGPRAVAVREAMRGLPVKVLVYDDFGSARDAIDLEKPMCLLLDVTTDVGRELLLDTTLSSELGEMSTIGIVSDPSSRETPEAFALGVDDVVGIDALAHVSLKVRDLLAGGAAPMIEQAPGVLVADPNRRRRAGVGGQMRRMGLRVRFALDHTEVRYEPGTRLVIASAWLPSVGAVAALHTFRRHRAAACVPWVFVGTPLEIERLQAALGNEPDVAYHRVDADLQVLVTAANTLLRPRTSTRRRSARIAFSVPVRFDVEGGWTGMWGCSSNLSTGGIFVRTLTSPPVGSNVRVTFTLPTQERLTIEGVVAWRVEPREGSGQAPGFGVQFPDPMPAAERATLDAGYRRLLALTAQARLQSAGV
jgi:uncharacterized protein (TIGR02266 family)